MLWKKTVSMNESHWTGNSRGNAESASDLYNWNLLCGPDNPGDEARDCTEPPDATLGSCSTDSNNHRVGGMRVTVKFTGLNGDRKSMRVWILKKAHMLLEGVKVRTSGLYCDVQSQRKYILQSRSWGMRRNKQKGDQENVLWRGSILLNWEKANSF